MTPVDAAIWGLVALGGLAGSALWSGTENGFYCLSRVRLDIRLSDRTDGAARRVHAELERPDRLLTTILLGNNICNYLGTLGVTALLEGAGLHAGLTVALQVMVLTPTLLVFGESLPKEYFRLNADRLPYRIAPVVTGFRWLATVTLVLPLLSLILRAATSKLTDESGGQDPRGRRRLLDLLEESAHQGAISGVQGALAERALAFERTRVRDVSVPWSSVDRVRLDDPPARAARVAAMTEKTWIPVVDRGGAVTGVVHAAALLSRPDALAELLEQPARLSPRDPLRGALARLVGTGVGIGIVEQRGRPVGLVGKRDLVRPLLGVTPI